MVCFLLRFFLIACYLLTHSAGERGGRRCILGICFEIFLYNSLEELSYGDLLITCLLTQHEITNSAILRQGLLVKSIHLIDQSPRKDKKQKEKLGGKKKNQNPRKYFSFSIWSELSISWLQVIAGYTDLSLLRSFPFK